MTSKTKELEDEIRKLKSMCEFVDNSEGNKQMNKVFGLIRNEREREMIEKFERFRNILTNCCNDELKEYNEMLIDDFDSLIKELKEKKQ